MKLAQNLTELPQFKITISILVIGISGIIFSSVFNQPLLFESRRTEQNSKEKLKQKTKSSNKIFNSG